MNTSKKSLIRYLEHVRANLLNSVASRDSAVKDHTEQLALWIAMLQDLPETSISDPDHLLEIARSSGLRALMHGVSAAHAREALLRFTMAVAETGRCDEVRH